MSLTNTLQNTIQQIINKFIVNISEKYNIDQGELMKLWSGDDKKTVAVLSSDDKKTVAVLSSVDTEDFSVERLTKCTKKELEGLCKIRKLKVSGIKDALIARLLGKEEPEAGASKTKEVDKKKVNKTETSQVIQKLITSIKPIAIRKNAFRNLEHLESGLVLDEKTKMVIGKQKPNGDIDPLQDDDIENCKKYKLSYTIPENLENKNNLDKVKVQELEDELQNYEDQKELHDEDIDDEDEDIDDEDEDIDDEDEDIEADLDE